MQKFVLTCFLSACALTAFAQIPDITGPILDAAEDTVHVVTIADIMTMQEKVVSQHSTFSHFEKVWGYKSFFNISYLTQSTLKPKEKISLGYDEICNGIAPDFKADYGLALQLGHNYNLLKKPIANIVNFNIDFTYIDLSLSHYKKEPGEHVYNSDNVWKDESESTYKYIPWCLSKYDINYGMNIGPSITVAPFTMLNIRQLHFLKLNFYYHIGYQFGILWMTNDKYADASKREESYNYGDPLKINWQHGLTQSFGLNLSWRTIGIGFETRCDSRTYMSFDKVTYGNKKYSFGANNSRIYIKICY